VERITDMWSYAPTYLIEAVDELGPVARMKKVIAFVISGMICSIC